MKPFETKDYKAFTIFEDRWALVTAGTLDNFNTCTVSWGSMGNIWGPNGGDISTVTVYIHPARYTQEFMAKYDTFTVSFFPESYRKALGYLGSHSGRNENKVANSGLTPVVAGDGVTFKEAELTFVCKKLYEHQFDEAYLAEKVKDYYASNPAVYTQAGHDRWEPHYMYIGEVVDAIEGQSVYITNEDIHTILWDTVNAVSQPSIFQFSGTKKVELLSFSCSTFVS